MYAEEEGVPDRYRVDHLPTLYRTRCSSSAHNNSRSWSSWLMTSYYRILSDYYYCSFSGPTRGFLNNTFCRTYRAKFKYFVTIPSNTNFHSLSHRPQWTNYYAHLTWPHYTIITIITREVRYVRPTYAWLPYNSSHWSPRYRPNTVRSFMAWPYYGPTGQFYRSQGNPTEIIYPPITTSFSATSFTVSSTPTIHKQLPPPCPALCVGWGYPDCGKQFSSLSWSLHHQQRRQRSTERGKSRFNSIL